MRISIALLFCATLAAQTAPNSAAKLTVDGDVAAPMVLTAADLAKMPRQTATLTDMQGAKVAYEGVALTEVLAKAGISFGKEMRGKALAGYLLVEAKDGYQVVFSLGELDPGVGGARVIVADASNGKPLPNPQGPIRLVVASDNRPARSVRMVQRLHVVLLRK
jgi:DMSO/TMAO reductase YedYZ molybdopterin-dependent catalytic subunit